MAMGLEMAPGGISPIAGAVRAYFAPIGTGFDATVAGLPGAPWMDLGLTSGFVRRCGTKVEALTAGAPGVAVGQVRSAIEAEVDCDFESWGKLPMALSGGGGQVNLLRGGFAAVALGADSSATGLDVGATAAAGFAVGDLVAVDVDYAGQTGAIGNGVAGGYLKAAVSDTDYVRRVTLNVGRVAGVAGGVLTLEAPLLAGVPGAGMKVSLVEGLMDREGSTFFQEWAGLFVVQGMQGERVSFMYPRLQVRAGAAEETAAVGVFEKRRLAGRFRALAVKDALDGAMVVCYRSYVAS